MRLKHDLVPHLHGRALDVTSVEGYLSDGGAFWLSGWSLARVRWKALMQEAANAILLCCNIGYVSHESRSVVYE